MSVLTEDKKKENESDYNIECIGNCIHFTDDIEDGSIMALMKIMRELEIKLLNKQTKYIGFKPSIWLFIKSDGGDIFSGFSAMDYIRNMSKSVPVYTVADGMCASAGK